MAARALTLCLAVSLCAARTGEIFAENNSEILARSLRRKLIQNNYDYMSSESHETSTPQTQYRKQFQGYDIVLKDDPSSDKTHEYTYYEKYRQTINFRRSKKLPSRISDNIENFKDDSSIINSNTQSIDEDLKDIVQGKETKINRVIPDRIFQVEGGEDIRYNPKYKNEISYEDKSFTGLQQPYNNNDNNMRMTTAKYKILKVKKSYRRSGSPSTLIQEETPEGVSIVNVGGGPFPDFRLPRARRQYMHLPANIGSIDEEDEVPPPPVNETNTAIEETKPKETYEPLEILLANDNSNKEAQNTSLVITVMPDEIFVL